MPIPDVVKAILLGVVEGFTEFLPVSSTGHLLLVEHFIGFRSTGKTFEVLIQLGAILAIMLVYARRLFAILLALPRDRETQRFVLGVLIAFLPAMILGWLAHGYIKEVLFNPLIVCVALIVGGLILIVVDDMPVEPRYFDVLDLPVLTCLKIGVAQCLAMVPGVSRSGATIVSALLLGADRRTAAEFSFFLAMPTMTGAFAYDLYKNYSQLSANDGLLIGAGLAAAFVSGLIVVRGFLDFVSRHGFLPFAWWRILVGTAGLAGLWVYG